ncbi:hypothetical protein Tco_1215233 [Tanacetum coccineum]
MDYGTINVPHLLAQYLFRHAEGRKNGARLSGGHFIGRLAMHFRLDNDDGLRGCSTQGLREAPPHRQAGCCGPGVPRGPMRLIGKLTRLCCLLSYFCLFFLFCFLLCLLSGEFQDLRVAATTPAQAPPPPLPAPHPRTMSQRIERLEEEVHNLRRDVVGLQGDVWALNQQSSLESPPG